MAEETLSGKITVVTGGARGIGYAVAERLLREGAKVAFCALRQESVDEAVGRLKSKGEVLGMAADVSKYEDVKRFIAAVTREFGRLDVLVNNVGIRTYKSVRELEPAEWDRMLAVNLSAAFYCSHEVLPIFLQQGCGDIVNISSLSSTSAFAGGAGYNASKAGLNLLSDATLLDHRYDGVRVCDVMPGSTDTEFNGPKTSGNTGWKVSPDDIAAAVTMVLQMPRRCTVSRIDVKPTRPPRKSQ